MSAARAAPPGRLESARRDDDVLYAAYVLVLVLGLRKGELLELTRELVNLDAGELYVGEQVQRVGHQLLRREPKTETSEGPLPLPHVCIAALKLRRQQRDADHARSAEAWIDSGLVFTTRHGTAIEPRNFNRSFEGPSPGRPSGASLAGLAYVGSRCPPDDAGAGQTGYSAGAASGAQAKAAKKKPATPLCHGPPTPRCQTGKFRKA